jgi:endonuclease/exonuclease/phosphatase family metal-dependent hydrolase
MLQLDYAFAPTIPWSGGQYGILTLSRYPLHAVRRVPLSNALAREPRTALEVELCFERACLRIVNHHADLVLAASAQSTRELLQDLAPRVGSGVGLVGDLNQVASDEGPRACSAASLQDIGQRFGAALTEGDRRIDYVFLDDALARCVQNMTVQPEHDSDHNSLAVDLDLGCLTQR